MAATNANLNYTVQNDSLALGDLNAVDLDLSGNLRVTGSISPGTFTNRVVAIVDAPGGAGGEVGNGPLTAAQSGTTFTCGAVLTGGGCTLTLPPAQEGLNYKIIFTAAPGQNLTITCDATVAERLAGLLNMNGGTVTQKGVLATLVCNTAALALGDQVTIAAYGTGGATNWQVYATGVANATFT